MYVIRRILIHAIGAVTVWVCVTVFLVAPLPLFIKNLFLLFTAPPLVIMFGTEISIIREFRRKRHEAIERTPTDKA